MQPDLPWNVAGIPPEAREAARAAARREGLSVGDWLTRRILRTFAEGNESVDNLRQSYRQTSQAFRAPEIEQRTDSTALDSDEMLARVSRSETETQNAWKRIEDQLRGVTRRLDQAERSQTENHRTMNRAAAEINVAAHEQTQAFDLLGGQILGMNQRLARLERDSAHDGVKGAVKALHQGLSRLADQVSQTANHSATQIAALAGNVEQLASKLIEARGDLEQTSRALDERVATAEANARQAEIQARLQIDTLEKAIAAIPARGDIEGLAHALEDRVGAVESRVQEAERAAQARADSFDKVLTSIGDSEDARKRLETELQRHVSGLQQLNDTLDQLSARVTVDSAAAAGTMARLEQSVAKLEARSDDPEHRLHGIENALSDIVARLESTERNTIGAAGAVEEGLRNLAMRVDAADKRHREAVAELRTAVTEATGRLEVTDAQAPSPPPASAQPAQPHFDLPPFPDQQGQGFENQPPTFAAQPPQPEAEPVFAAETPFGAHSFGVDPFAPSAAQPADAAGEESFLAAARRAARTAGNDPEPQAASFGGFGWGLHDRESAAETKSPIARYAMIATLGLLIVAAIAAGALLARSLTAPPVPAAKLPVAPATVPAPNAGVAPSPAASLVPQTVVPTVPPPAETPSTPTSGSPVISQQPRFNPGPLESHRIAPQSQTHVAQQPAAASPQVSPLDKLSVLANAGSANAELLLGLKLLDGDGVAVNEAEAAKWLERAASQNVPVAAYRLGTLYERGHGVPADPVRAVQWYATAAKAGNRKAMHNLAVAYADGTGVAKDLVVAAQWFTRAANLGLADSQFNLAVLYERGMGVQQSLLDAYKWYAIAAAQGDAESKARIDALATQLSPEDKAAAQKAVASFQPDPLDKNANAPPDISMVLSG
jgi:localization factor PodJL